MRNILATAVGAALVFSAACSSNPGKGTSTGGTTTGIQTTCDIPGTACVKNGDCCSNDCAAGNPLGGLCCKTSCPAGDPHDLCTQPIGCDDAGACMYPKTGTSCGVTCGSGGTELIDQSCADDHVCHGGNTTNCSPYTCTNSQTCLTACTSDDAGQCAPSYYCNSGQCVPQNSIGACDSDAQCSSGVCGANHNCCSVSCPPSQNDTKDCNAAGCTPDGGACEYPVGHSCVANGINHLCIDNNTILGGACNFTGVCEMDAGICPNNVACAADQSGCSPAACRVAADCATGFYCKGSICIPRQVDGGCTSDDQCVSNVCGTNDALTPGSHCCALGCFDAGICGAKDCDGATAGCVFPDNTVSCGPAGSCNALTEMATNPTVCNKSGGCPPAATVACSPYLCNTDNTGCFTSCTDNSSCDATNKDICDTNATAQKCCAGYVQGQAIKVDGQVGVDAACCGIGGAANKPCLTITYAMNMIAGAQLKNAIIAAVVNKGAGDWAPAGEVYPIVLGWGVELQAGSVAFLDPTAAGAEIFDVKVMANDTLGYATIDGQPGKPVIIGYNAQNLLQTTDSSSVLVEKGATLYLSNASLNGNATKKTTAISLQGGATLTVGEAAPIAQANNGTVTIGTLQGAATDGWNGIVCAAGSASAPCTINDNTSLGANVSSLQIFNQENIDLEADDYAAVDLESTPQFGLVPGKPGFGVCTSKKDGKSGNGDGLLLDGIASVTLKNATVACIASAGIYMESTPNGSPTLTLESSTVENTEIGLYAGAGAATVSGGSIFQFNYNGVEIAGGTVNLDDATTGNTVVCDSNKESTVVPAPTAPGIGVLNTGSGTVDASNTSWNNKPADSFTCGSPVTAINCTCDSVPCAQTAGTDDMDSVDTGTGAITTTNGAASPIAVGANCK